MTSSLFFRKFSAFLIAILLVVPGFYTAMQAQKAMATLPVVCVNCATAPTQIQSLLDQFINTAKNIITSVQTTLTAQNTASLVFKEYTLDPIARLLGTQMTNMLVKQMFNFVANGNVIPFKQGETAKGTETYVTNPQQYFGSVGQESTQVYLTDLKTNRPDRMQSLNTVVTNRIIAENYTDTEKMKQSDFPGGDAGYQAFIQDASKCVTNNSWDCYFASLQPQNNPWDIYQFESQKLARQRQNDVKLAQDEVLAGSGYHTLKDCIDKDVNANCTQYLNRTPGDAIAGQVNDYLNDALKNLQNADEIDEVLTSVMKLTQDWMTGKGLANL